MDRQTIIMNFTAPPSPEDLEVMARGVLRALPDELMKHCEGMALRVEDFPDPATEQDQDLETPYDLLALFKSGSQLTPGVMRKHANDEDVLILYRRPILDMWCETGDDLGALVRQIIIGELGEAFEFTDDDIEQMAAVIAVNS